MARIAWIAVGLVLGFVSGRQVLSVAYGADAAYHDLEVFGNAMEVLHAYYVRPVEDDTLIAAAIQGMVSHLDPRSRYIDAKFAKDSGNATAGDFGGVGIEVEPEDGLIGVVSLIHGTPAAAAGIKAGDRIEAVDGTSIEGLSGDEAIERMRGPAGSKVTLTFVRTGKTNPFAVTLTRMGAEGDAVRYRREGEVGYIRLPNFGKDTAEGLEHAVRELKRRRGNTSPGIKGYVLDLRDNPGGALDQAVRVADDFLDSGEIVSVHGRDPGDTRRFDAKRGDILGGKPLVVLIDSGTAAAAEIVSGALQDHKRATIIGMTSSGNGSAQTIFSLAGFSPAGFALAGRPLAGGSIGLTTAYYFTPSGRAIQGGGIVPDIAVAEGDWDDVPVIEPVIVADEQTGGARGRLPVVRAAPGTKYDDFQLSYALDLLRGQKTVASSTSHLMEQIILYFTVRNA
jgi:carboxyl-terminal processing protease